MTAVRRPIALLMLSNVLGGVGVAAGIAVGVLLVQQILGTALAGSAAALVVLGSAVAAVPLAQLAVRRGRSRALATGYLVAALGAGATVLGAVLGSAAVLLLGGFLFGAGQATSLQTRFAAADHAAGRRKALLISLVFWTTTVGSVLGLNLATSGNALGRSLHLPDLTGPFVYAAVVFLLASLVVLALPAPEAGPTVHVDPGAVSTPAALRWAGRQPTARYAVALAVVAHAVMVGVMSMAPLDLVAHGHDLRAVGGLVSLHILGMFALSPAIGWLADRVGATRTSGIGLGLLLAGFVPQIATDTPGLGMSAASLVLLGLGWSVCVLSSSALLAGIDSGPARIPLQGASDALMNYAAAGAAALCGPLMAVAGYRGVNAAAAVLLVPALVVGLVAVRASRLARLQGMG